MLRSRQKEDKGKRRSCTFYGCMSVLGIFVILAGLLIYRSVGWQQFRISLPDGSGSVVYMVQRDNKSFFAEYDRKARVETNTMHGPPKQIPYDGGGGSPINVYWYPAHGVEGPYLRFQDPHFEYLMDIRHGKVLLIVRERRSVYAGEVLKQLSGWDSSGPISSLVDGKWVATNEEIKVNVDGRPAHKLEKWVASRPGRYIGRISDDYCRFIPDEESPEQRLPQY